MCMVCNSKSLVFLVFITTSFHHLTCWLYCSVRSGSSGMLPISFTQTVWGGSCTCCIPPKSITTSAFSTRRILGFHLQIGTKMSGGWWERFWPELPGLFYKVSACHQILVGLLWFDKHCFQWLGCWATANRRVRGRDDTPQQHSLWGGNTHWAQRAARGLVRPSPPSRLCPYGY